MYYVRARVEVVHSKNSHFCRIQMQGMTETANAVKTFFEILFIKLCPFGNLSFWQIITDMKF